MPNYAELHCISNFTFLRGASHPDELITRAYKLGYDALALTDECSLAGIVRAHITAKKLNFKLIIGSEFKLDNDNTLILLVVNRLGYRNLVKLITKLRLCEKKGSYNLKKEYLCRKSLDGCIALITCSYCPSSYLIETLRYKTLSDHGRILHSFMPDRVWIGLEQSGFGNDHSHQKKLHFISKKIGIPLVATGNIHMHAQSRHALQDTLTAIGLKKTLKEIKHKLKSNSESYLKSKNKLSHIYSDSLMNASINIAKLCCFTLDEIKYQYPSDFLPTGLTPTQYLRNLCNKGLKLRWPKGSTEKITKQIEKELSLITELGYEGYFLTVYDIVSFARSQNILCQGRGSAANSVVCFVLYITEVDPTKIDVLFERFLSRERNEPPDIDVDFEHDRRDEVIQYIYKRYGHHRAALTSTVVTYRSRSAIRDIGKVLGLSKNQINKFTDYFVNYNDSNRKKNITSTSKSLTKLNILAKQLIGFPRHLSQHPGGFVISHEPLQHLVPVVNTAMKDRTIIQWNKNDIDSLGILKIDILALGILTAIRKCFELIKAYSCRNLSISEIPSEDVDVYQMIGKADTVGVFQIESRAQMSMLPRLKPKCFYDLVIEVAIVRPGPIQGDMVHPYLRRRNGEESVSYPSESIRRVLGKTLGVPIFQEQVIRLAMVAGGFNPGEADGLRRAMSAWNKDSEIENYKNKLINGMLDRGYSEHFAQNIYKQIRGFAEYGFPESHAASFALLVYVSAWLKCHEPAAFVCALLNSQPMGFYTSSQLIQDAQRHNVIFHSIDVTKSDYDCTLESFESNMAVRLGLRMIKNLSRTGAKRIICARKNNPFLNLEDLAHRATLNQRDLRALAKSNALSNLACINRFHATWMITGIQKPLPIFPKISIQEGIPMLKPPSITESVYLDYSSTGITLGPHPLHLLRKQLKKLGVIASDEIYKARDGCCIHTAGIVVARQKPSSSKNTTFVTIEDEFGNINLIVWSKLANNRRRELVHSRLLGVFGQLQREGDVINIIASDLKNYTRMITSLSTSSYDFH